MRLRQEQAVFLAAVLVLGLLAWLELRGGVAQRRTSAPGEPAQVASHPAPDVALALPTDAPHRPLERNLLAPPSDVRPLPPLALVEPPRAPLAALAPPPEPGPAPRAYGALLSRDLAAAIDPAAAAALFAGADDALFEAPDESALFADDEDEAADETPFDPSTLTAQERQALIEGYKGQYDWFFDGVRTTFGRIENPDRYGLKADPARAGEALAFVEVVPEQGGVERFPGLPAVAVPRATVQDWDFAATFANEIEVRRRLLGDKVARSSFQDAMALADACVRGRLEAPRALAIAEELYTLCAEFDARDPDPKLGLARCYEAGFRFDAAFDVYRRLCDEFPANAAVRARLGLLEARFFLLERAEERLREAVRIDRGSWEAQWALGRFLADRGRPEEALAFLEAADRAVPNDPGLIADRVAIRVDLAAARLSVGEVREARALFGRALAIDPAHQRARAGWIATGLCAPPGGLNGESEPPAESAETDPGLELLLARGLAAAAAGDAAGAKALLESAAAADPLRANLAWRALSWLAEAADAPGEATRYVELALECDPTDAWALYQAGRLRAAEEDVPGARAAFLAALDVDLDFVDALAALGETAFEVGEFDDAERYLERAIALDPERVALHGLRGLNHLQRGSVPEARAAFERGRELAPDDETCRAGLAWCTYLSGDPEQAMVELRELDDALRARPAEDPLRAWAVAQIDRIQDHLRKVEWSDAFERKELRNGWDYREDAGPVHRLQDGALALAGTFQKTGASLWYRTLPASLFVAVEADLWIDPATKADVGLFLARESTRRAATETLERVAVVRHHDGSLQVSLQKEGATARFVDMEEPFPTGRWVRLRIERTGDETDTKVTLYADGVPLIENFAMTSLRANTELQVGVLVEGEPGRAVSAQVDDVRLVYREAR